MCDFLSGFLRLCDERVIIRDTRSHSRTAEIAGILPDTAREWEWTSDRECDLTVRRHVCDEHDEAWYRACILALGETRIALLTLLLREDAEWRAWLAGDGDLEEVGDLDLSGLRSADGLVLPENIGGDCDLSRLVDANGLTLPEHIGGDCDLSQLIHADGLTLPQHVGGSVHLSCLQHADGLVLPSTIGHSLFLPSLISARGVTWPTRVGGDMELDSLESADGLVLPQELNGRLYAPLHVLAALGATSRA